MICEVTFLTIVLVALRAILDPAPLPSSELSISASDPCASDTDTSAPAAANFLVRISYALSESKVFSYFATSVELESELWLVLI